MFKTIKMIVKYSRMKKQDDKRRRQYLKMPLEELNALPDDALFDALTARTEAMLIKAGGFIDGVDSLSNAEKVFYIASYYEMEVNNGGLCQFFVNSSRMLAPMLLDCLREIGADEHAKLFETFVADNGIDLNELSSFAVDSYEEYEKRCESYPFDDFDDKFYELDAITDLLTSYAREHISEF